MKIFVDATRKAINDKNWYAGLALSLALPDMCSKLEFPAQKTGVRYRKWYNKYLLQNYTIKIGVNKTTKVLLNADDFYALRCSYLHQGSHDITTQDARKLLEDFKFVSTRKGLTVHKNQINNTLQLQVDIFCEEICLAVEKWIDDVFNNDDEIKKRSKQLLIIHHLENDFLV